MPSNSPPPVWFITGVSNGFGLLLALRALGAGHRVVGTMRNRARYADTSARQIEALGGEIVEMDMTESQTSIRAKVGAVGRIDYLVNNAGYGLFCALEQVIEEDANTQITTNLLGPIYVMQGALEGMRARRSGLIINISSIAARDPLATSSLYAASKAALEALSESLQHEVSEFGIRILIVDPGAFRTNFQAGIVFSSVPLPTDYEPGVVGQALRRFADGVGKPGKQPGDPVKAVERIFEFVVGEGLAGELARKGTEQGEGDDGETVLRLVLGEDAVTRMRRNNERFVRDYTLGEEVALSTGFSE